MALPKTPSLRLDGKCALVVGASSGIGAACAVALGEAGAVVTLAARRLEPLEQLADEMTSEGMAAQAVAMDVSDAEATAVVVAETGPFDVLVNSAGFAKHSPASETMVADYDLVTNLNVRGAYFLTQAVAKGLIAAGKPGSLINISSQMGHIGGVDRAVYSATKHAVEGFTKGMAIDWGYAGIRVNTICPTFIVTPLTEGTLSDPKQRAWIEGKIKLGRVGAVEDLMGPVVFLASDASALVTGSALMVDGGWTAG